LAVEEAKSSNTGSDGDGGVILIAALQQYHHATLCAVVIKSRSVFYNQQCIFLKQTLLEYVC